MHDSATGQINAIRLTFNSCQKHEIETKGISFLLSKNDPIWLGFHCLVNLRAQNVSSGIRVINLKYKKK